jgi:hypothetical protein
MALNTRAVSQVISYVNRQFGDESGVQIVEGDVIRWINQACTEINSKNKVLRASATAVAVPGVGDYPKPNDTMQITAVKYDQTILTPMGWDSYLTAFSGGSAPDSPQFWTQYASNITIGSAPTDNATITIYYVPEPRVVGSSGDILPLPDRYFDRICEYCMSKAYELDEDWPGHSAQRKLFEESLNELSQAESDMSGPYPVVVDYTYE